MNATKSSDSLTAIHVGKFTLQGMEARMSSIACALPVLRATGNRNAEFTKKTWLFSLHARISSTCDLNSSLPFSLPPSLPLSLPGPSLPHLLRASVGRHPVQRHCVHPGHPHAVQRIAGEARWRKDRTWPPRSTASRVSFVCSLVFNSIRSLFLFTVALALTLAVACMCSSSCLYVVSVSLHCFTNSRCILASRLLKL